MVDKPSLEGEIVDKSPIPLHTDGTIDLYAIVQNASRYPVPAEPIEGEFIVNDRTEERIKALAEAFGELAEKDLYKRFTPIEGEVVPPSPREQALSFMLNAMKESHRNPHRPVLEGEVIATPLQIEKKD